MNKKFIGGAMALLMAVAPLPGVSAVSNLPIFSQISITAEAAVSGSYRVTHPMPIYANVGLNAVVTTAPRGATITVIRTVNNNLLEVNFSGRRGLVRKEWILNSQRVVPVSSGTYRTNTQVRLTSNPNGAAVVGVVPARATVTSIGYNMNGWIRVQYRGAGRNIIGWVIGRSLTRV